MRVLVYGSETPAADLMHRFALTEPAPETVQAAEQPATERPFEPDQTYVSVQDTSYGAADFGPGAEPPLEDGAPVGGPMPSAEAAVDVSAAEQTPDETPLRGWSKRTEKILASLRHAFSRGVPAGDAAAAAAEAPLERTLHFNDVLPQRTRRIAAAYFFEMLVLKSKGYLDVRQREPGGAIELRAEPPLFGDPVMAH